eukprot:TRINITY_DN40409_c2_g1_i1.p1 TRINITY_DN40409_c2_g1~~TRINITY_DN40409_c2_g1_i1.p1  ORF type:complete len:153 (-),score=7.51 TRINITY_DN40409_c2_g1_i1:394-852(-)
MYFNHKQFEYHRIRDAYLFFFLFGVVESGTTVVRVLNSSFPTPYHNQHQLLILDKGASWGKQYPEKISCFHTAQNTQWNRSLSILPNIQGSVFENERQVFFIRKPHLYLVTLRSTVVVNCCYDPRLSPANQELLKSSSYFQKFISCRKKYAT